MRKLGWVLAAMLAVGVLVGGAAAVWHLSAPPEASERGTRQTSASSGSSAGIGAPAETDRDRLVRLMGGAAPHVKMQSHDGSDPAIERLLLPEVDVPPIGTIPEPTVLHQSAPRPTGYRPVAIVVHSTGSGTPGTGFSSLEDLRAYFATSLLSSHYAIDRDGRIAQYVTDDRAAFHTAQKGWNGISLGIELLNDGSGEDPFPTAQVASLQRLVVWLGAVHGIAADAVVRHRDVQRNRADPPDNLDWSLFMSAISERAGTDDGSGNMTAGTGSGERLDSGRGRLDAQ